MTVSTMARLRASNLLVSRIKWFFMLRLGLAKNSMPRVSKSRSASALET
jgi:hypothetical protein